jgi:hypothetical protein
LNFINRVLLRTLIDLVVNRETVVERKKPYERTEGSGDWGTEKDENDARETAVVRPTTAQRKASASPS